MIGQFVRSINRTARGSSGCRHEAVFYNVTVGNVENKWRGVRIGWVLGKGRPDQWTHELRLENGSAAFNGEVRTQHTLYQTKGGYLPKTVTVVFQATLDGSHFHRIASLVVDIGTMCNSSSKGLVNTTVQSMDKGRKGQQYMIEMRIAVPTLSRPLADGAMSDTTATSLSTDLTHTDTSHALDTTTNMTHMTGTPSQALSNRPSTSNMDTDVHTTLGGQSTLARALQTTEGDSDSGSTTETDEDLDDYIPSSFSLTTGSPVKRIGKGTALDTITPIGQEPPELVMTNTSANGGWASDFTAALYSTTPVLEEANSSSFGPTDKIMTMESVKADTATDSTTAPTVNERAGSGPTDADDDAALQAALAKDSARVADAAAAASQRSSSRKGAAGAAESPGARQVAPAVLVPAADTQGTVRAIVGGDGPVGEEETSKEVISESLRQGSATAVRDAVAGLVGEVPVAESASGASRHNNGRSVRGSGGGGPTSGGSSHSSSGAGEKHYVAASRRKDVADRMNSATAIQYGRNGAAEGGSGAVSVPRKPDLEVRPRPPATQKANTSRPVPMRPAPLQYQPSSQAAGRLAPMYEERAGPSTSYSTSGGAAQVDAAQADTEPRTAAANRAPIPAGQRRATPKSRGRSRPTSKQQVEPEVPPRKPAIPAVARGSAKPRSKPQSAEHHDDAAAARKPLLDTGLPVRRKVLVREHAPEPKPAPKSAPNLTSTPRSSASASASTTASGEETPGRSTADSAPGARASGSTAVSSDAPSDVAASSAASDAAGAGKLAADKEPARAKSTTTPKPKAKPQRRVGPTSATHTAPPRSLGVPPSAGPRTTGTLDLTRRARSFSLDTPAPKSSSSAAQTAAAARSRARPRSESATRVGSLDLESVAEAEAEARLAARRAVMSDRPWRKNMKPTSSGTVAQAAAAAPKTRAGKPSRQNSLSSSDSSRVLTQRSKSLPPEPSPRGAPPPRKPRVPTISQLGIRSRSPKLMTMPALSETGPTVARGDAAAAATHPNDALVGPSKPVLNKPLTGRDFDLSSLDVHKQRKTTPRGSNMVSKATLQRRLRLQQEGRVQGPRTAPQLSSPSASRNEAGSKPRPSGTSSTDVDTLPSAAAALPNFTGTASASDAAPSSKSANLSALKATPVAAATSTPAPEPAASRPAAANPGPSATASQAPGAAAASAASKAPSSTPAAPEQPDARTPATPAPPVATAVAPSTATAAAAGASEAKQKQQPRQFTGKPVAHFAQSLVDLDPRAAHRPATEAEADAQAPGDPSVTNVPAGSGTWSEPRAAVSADAAPVVPALGTAAAAAGQRPEDTSVPVDALSPNSDIPPLNLSVVKPADERAGTLPVSNQAVVTTAVFEPVSSTNTISELSTIPDEEGNLRTPPDPASNASTYRETSSVAASEAAAVEPAVPTIAHRVVWSGNQAYHHPHGALGETSPKDIPVQPQLAAQLAGYEGAMSRTDTGELSLPEDNVIGSESGSFSPSQSVAMAEHSTVVSDGDYATGPFVDSIIDHEIGGWMQGASMSMVGNSAVVAQSSSSVEVLNP